MGVEDKLRENVERGEDEVRRLEREAADYGMDRVLIDDDPAKLPPELRRTLDGRARRWFLRTWPPQQLMPDAEPAYVRSWFYTMGVASLACIITLFVTGILLALGGPEFWLTNRVGQFIDQLHYWAVVLLFLFMTVHWILVFLMGGFRGRRFTSNTYWYQVQRHGDFLKVVSQPFAVMRIFNTAFNSVFNTRFNTGIGASAQSVRQDRP